MGSIAAGVYVLRGDRTQGFCSALATDLLWAQCERERTLSASVRTWLRGDAYTLVQEDGGLAICPGLLRHRFRQTLLPRYTALRDTGDDTKDTTIEGTATASHAIRSAALHSSVAGNG